MGSKTEIRKFSNETWTDFTALLQTDRQCSECWCLNHREPPGCPTGEAAQAKMQKLMTENKVGGLLAYQDQKCVGWIAIDPISDLAGHDCQSSGKKNEWAIHCIYVRDGFRGQGISTELITAAIHYAKSRGASLISAFPIPSENRNRFPPNEAEFSGRLSTYSKFGFKPEGEASEFYQRMELQ